MASPYYQLQEWQNSTGYKATFVSLIGVKLPDWKLPMKVMGISFAEFVDLMKTKYKAKITIYRHPITKKFNFIGWQWDTLQDCRVFKNYFNKLARDYKLDLKKINTLLPIQNQTIKIEINLT